jgi:hypothetical protein
VRAVMTAAARSARPGTALLSTRRRRLRRTTVPVNELIAESMIRLARMVGLTSRPVDQSMGTVTTATVGARLTIATFLA